MTVIVTMAGNGSRFYDAGYTLPKFMIEAKGKTLFEWSLLSMKEFFEQKFIFACLESHDVNWIGKKADELGIKRYVIVPRHKTSEGQAQTAYDVTKYADEDENLWVMNIDTYISDGMTPKHIMNNYGCIYVFKSTNPGLSYVSYINEVQNEYIKDVAEKKVISSWASVGVYGFKNSKIYSELYKRAYEDKIITMTNGEEYIMPMYKLLLIDSQLKQIIAPKLYSQNVHVLGTPEDLIAFNSNAIRP